MIGYTITGAEIALASWQVDAVKRIESGDPISVVLSTCPAGPGKISVLQTVNRRARLREIGVDPDQEG